MKIKPIFLSTLLMGATLPALLLAGQPATLDYFDCHVTAEHTIAVKQVGNHCFWSAFEVGGDKGTNKIWMANTYFDLPSGASDCHPVISGSTVWENNDYDLGFSCQVPLAGTGGTIVEYAPIQIPQSPKDYFPYTGGCTYLAGTLACRK